MWLDSGMTKTQGITRKQRQMIDFHLRSFDTVEGYKRLLAVAVDQYMEYEVERLTRDFAEAEQDTSDTFDAMCESGVTPEMFEAYVS